MPPPHAHGAAGSYRDPGLPDLRGRIAVVTGASGGIGAGIARRLAAAGARVVIGYRSDRTGADTLAAELNRDAHGTAGSADPGSPTPETPRMPDTPATPRAVAHQTDITDPDSCAALVQRAVGQFGALDILVNNAGIQPLQPLPDMTPADWHTVIHANATGTFTATRAAAAVMCGRGGSIIHIASIEGTAPAVNHAHYAASKAAVIMYAKAAALEYGPLGIRVNAVSPGLIDREGLAESWPDGVARYRAAAPLGRLGTAGEIGDACVFLASDMARWITGANLVVDGGVSIRSTW